MKKQILFISSFPPRECGIATFTQDLTRAFKKLPDNEFTARIGAMDNKQSQNLSYGSEVKLRIRELEVKNYLNAAKTINKDPNISMVNIQHEFGLYGGIYLNALSALLENLRKPSVITFHTVLPKPNDALRDNFRYLVSKAAHCVIPAKIGLKILKQDYGIDTSKFSVIPHGIHDVPFEPSEIQKSKLGLDNRTVMLSFGLISGGKGYEYVIDALPKAVKKNPEILYLIVGATHPGIKKQEGEKYRKFLKERVRSLSLMRNVAFVNKYLSTSDLLKYLRAADIYIGSGLGASQLVSGTLSYAMGSGRPVIMHPILHALELVSPQRGIIVKLKDSGSYSRAITTLAADSKLRHSMGENAYEYTRPMLWENVARQYLQIFRKLSR